MRKTSLLYTALLLALMAIGNNLYAQSSIYNPAVVWKKRVAREIEFSAKESTRESKHHARDSSLAEMMINAVLAGKVISYSDIDQEFTTIQTADDLRVILGLRETSATGYDYNKKRQIADGSHSKFSYDSVYRYRLLEEWEYNPSTNTTDIHIVSIAPIRDYYYNDEFRAKQAIFWLRFSDAMSIIQRYDSKHTDKPFISATWKDHFSYQRPMHNTKFKVRVAREIDLASHEDSATYYLKDVNNDSTILQFANTRLVAGAINLYDSADNTMRKEQYRPKPDTTMVFDPVTGAESQATVKHDNIIGYYHNIKIIEEWTYLPATASIRVVPKAIVPFRPMVSYDGRTYRSADDGWLHYDDIKDIIASYEQTHPTNNFATKIWNSYFYSDVKPSVIK